MSLIKCQCMHCGGSIEFDEDAAGQETECPHCHKKTWVDLPGKMTYVPPNAKNQFRSTDVPPLKPPQLSRLLPCSDCTAPISKDAVICPRCGQIPSIIRIATYVFGISFILGIIFMVFAVLFAAMIGVMGTR